MNKIIFSTLAALLFSALLCLNYGHLQTEAIPLLGLRCARDFVVGFISDRIMERNPEFEKVTQRIVDRVEQEIEAGAITDKAQIEALHQRIIIEEIRGYQVQLDKESGTGNQMSIEESDKELTAQAEALNSCEKNSEGQNESEPLDIVKDKELEEEEARRLKDDIAKICEKKMDFSLIVKDKEVQAKTKDLLGNLLHTEVRQLALSCMATFHKGGPIGSIIQKYGKPIKSKLANHFLDVLNDLTGPNVDHSIEYMIGLE